MLLTMDRKEAEQLLADVEVVPLLQAPIADAKELLAACLDAGVPAVLGRDDHCTTGCAPKLMLLARPEDAARVGTLLRERFGRLVALEGTLLEPRALGPGETPDDVLPCPACGTAIPDDVSECPDCGLGVG